MQEFLNWVSKFMMEDKRVTSEKQKRVSSWCKEENSRPIQYQEKVNDQWVTKTCR